MLLFEGFPENMKGMDVSVLLRRAAEEYTIAAERSATPPLSRLIYLTV